MQVFTIDGVQVPQLPDYQSVTSASSPVTNQKETEGGTIVREIVRNKRREVKAKWTLSETDLKTLHDMVMDDSITLVTYMPDLGTTSSMICFVDEFEPEVVSGGKRWEISLVFKEL